MDRLNSVEEKPQELIIVPLLLKPLVFRLSLGE